MLATAGADDAKAIFFCVNDREGARKAVLRVRERFPNLLALYSTYDRFSEIELLEAGAEITKRETLESAVSLARIGLKWLGEDDVIEEVIEEYRKYDAEMMRLQIEYGLEQGADGGEAGPVRPRHGRPPACRDGA